MFEVLVRGRFVPVPQATCTPVQSNVWTVTMPNDAATARLLRTTLDEKGLDELVVSIDLAEAMQCLLSDIQDSAITLTVLLP
ncbi:MAG: hypothetical protein ACI9MC_002863 [Kiritimatiellia bacterium]|jgi:hypothetical protein